MSTTIETINLNGLQISVTKSSEGYICPAGCETMSKDASNLRKHLNRKRHEGWMSNLKATSGPNSQIEQPKRKRARHALHIEQVNPEQVDPSQAPETPYMDGIDPPLQTITIPSASVQHIIRHDDLTRWGVAVYLPFRLFLCVECEYCVRPWQLHSHLREVHKTTQVPAENILEAITQLNLCGSEAEVTVPCDNSPPLPGLQTLSGFQCSACGYKTISDDGIRKHVATCKANIAAHRKNVILQTFFPPTTSGYIVVQALPPQPSNTAFNIFKILRHQDQDTYNPSILPVNDIKAIHPFLLNSDWAIWLSKQTMRGLERLQALGEEWEGLEDDVLECWRIMWGRFSANNANVRCVLNSPETQINHTPFAKPATAETQKRYALQWAKFLGWVFACLDMADGDRAFTLTDHQIAVLLHVRATLNTSKNVHERCAAVEEASYALIASNLGDIEGEESHPIITHIILRNTVKKELTSTVEQVSPTIVPLEYAFRAFVFAKMWTAQESRRTPNRLTLHKQLEAEMEWLKEGRDTSFTYLRRMVHLSSSFAYDARKLPRFKWNTKDSGASFTFQGDTITVDAFKGMIQGALQDVQMHFEKLLSATGGAGREMTDADMGDIHDAWDNESPNYSFLNDRRNKGLKDRVEAFTKRVLDSGRFCKVIGKELFYKTGAIHGFLKLTVEFGKALLAASYLLGGQPPRGSELIEALIRNIGGRVRNIYFVEGDIMNCGFLNKTTFTSHHDKVIPRSYPTILSHLIIKYLAFIRPIEHILTTWTSIVSADDAQHCLTHLFFFNGKKFTTNTLTAQLRDLAVKHLGVDGSHAYGTRDMRQILIFWGLRHIVPHLQPTEHHRAVLDLQAGHTTQIAKHHYAVTAGRLGSLDSDEVDDYLTVSRLHHNAFGLGQLPPTETTTAPIREQEKSPTPPITILEPAVVLKKKAAEGMDMSMEEAYYEDEFMDQDSEMPITEMLSPMVMAERRPHALVDRWELDQPPITTLSLDGIQMLVTHVVSAIEEKQDALVEELTNNIARMQISPLPSHTIIPHPIDIQPPLLTAVSELYGGYGFKSVEQGQATAHALQGQHHMVVVLPTGAGKTAIYLVPAVMEAHTNSITLIVIPLLSLMADMRKRLIELRIEFAIWDQDIQPAFATVVLITPERLAGRHFQCWFKEVIHNGSLRRIVVEEAGYMVYNPEFRPAILDLDMLITAGVSILAVTATLPPSDTLLLLRLLNIPQPLEIRCPTHRPEIAYKVLQVKPETEEHPIILQALYNGLLSSYDDHCSEGSITVGSGVVFFQFKVVLTAIAEKARADEDFPFKFMEYHGDMEKDERDEVMAAWLQNPDLWLFATKAAQLGLDKAKVTFVGHIGCPQNYVDYAQESGRAGRNGERSEAVIIYHQPPPLPSTDEKGGRRQLIKSLSSKRCRRQMMQEYLDGSAYTCLSLGSSTHYCDNCWMNLGSAGEFLSAPLPTTQILTNAEAEARNPTTREVAVRNWAEAVMGKCGVCYTGGRGLNTHHAAFCPTSEVDVDTSYQEIKKFKRWMTTQDGRRPLKNFCWKCLLPQTGVFHYGVSKDDWKKKGGENCRFDKVMDQFLWGLTQSARTVEELADQKFASEEELAGWLKDHNGKMPRWYLIIMAYDEQLKKNPNKISVEEALSLL